MGCAAGSSIAMPSVAENANRIDTQQHLPNCHFLVIKFALAEAVVASLNAQQFHSGAGD
jgi:hypothetical protein